MLGKNRQKKAAIDTLIGAGTTLVGDVAFRGGLHVDGEVRGNVVGQNDGTTLFSISPDGRIEGSVDASEVIVNGAVDGDVIARDRVELGPTARVTGNVMYGLIQMAIGAEVNGKLIHQPTAKPIVNFEDPVTPAGDDDAAADDALGVS